MAVVFAVVLGMLVLPMMADGREPIGKRRVCAGVAERREADCWYDESDGSEARHHPKRGEKKQ